MTRSSRLLPVALGALALAIVIRTPFTGPAAARSAAEDGHNIAICETLKIVDELMESDRFKPDRNTLEEAKKAQVLPLYEERQALGQRGQAAQAAGEDVSGIAQEFQALQQRIQQAEQQAQQEIAELMSKQIGECYDLIKASASAIAKDLGYDYVVSSSRPDDQMGPNPSGEFLSRPMLVFPEDTDITDDVREDLKLE